MSAQSIFINGNIHTMDARTPHAEAVAVRDDRILAVGSNQAMRDLLAPGGRVVDLGGRTVVPGLIDAHLHFLAYGLSLGEIDLINVPTLAAALDRVAVHAAATPAGITPV